MEGFQKSGVKLNNTGVIQLFSSDLVDFLLKLILNVYLFVVKIELTDVT